MLALILILFSVIASNNSQQNLIASDDKPTQTQKANDTSEPQIESQSIVQQRAAGSNNSKPDSSSTITKISSSEVKVSNNDTIVTPSGKTYPLRTYRPLATPNDPYASQWWVSNTGLSTAWDYSAGSYQTLVAIIDTGFGLNHQEFTNRWYTNTGESGTTTNQGAAPNCTSRGLSLDKSCNNLDDDGNGYIDDYRGWDFMGSDNSVKAGETNPNGDDVAHGTMVAGVLGATGNNGVGLAGVNWNTKMLPIQAIDDDGYGNTLTVADAIIYAADQNADIISLSLGSTLPDPYLREAIAYAIESGSTIVAATGNDNCNCISYPANYPEVLAVGSSNSSNGRSSFSNYGTNIDIIAPGESIISTYWTNANQTSNYASNIAGTSFSTPLVSGLLALAKSKLPDASWGELTAALTEESNRLSSSASSPHSIYTGYGIAKADNLLRRVTTSVSSSSRYHLGPIEVNDTLDSWQFYQCEGSRLPTTPIYELKSGSVIKFTISELARQKAVDTGWSVNKLFYGCVGLSIDSVSLARSINLLGEIYDLSTKNNYN